MNLVVLTGGALLLAVLAMCVGFLIGRFIWPSKHGIDPAEFALAQGQAMQREQECQILRTHVDGVNAQYAAAVEQARTSGEEVARLGERIVSLTHQIDEKAA